MKTDMKIAILTDRLSIGGGCEYLYQLAKGMPEHTFFLFAEGGGYADLTELSNVRYLPGKICPERINAVRPDVVHSNHLRTLLAVRSGLKTPLLHTVHGNHLHRYEFLHGVSMQIKRFLRFRLEHFLYQRCRHIIALTPSDMAFLKETLKISTPITVIPNGIASSAISGNLLPWKYVMIGRFDFQKGFDVLVRAVTEKATQLRSMHRVIHLIGDGPERKKIHQMIVQNGISDLLPEEGSIPNVGRRLTPGSVVLMPSRWEGLPFLALEAGLHRCMLIGADVPGIHDIVRQEANGLLFPCEDAEVLGTLLVRDYPEESIRQYGNALYQTVDTYFNIHQMLEKTHSLYQYLALKQ